MILQLVLHVLFVVGLVDVTTQEFVFERCRNWVLSRSKSTYLNTFTTCPICQSFWASLCSLWLFPCLVHYWFAVPFIALLSTKIIFEKILTF